MEYERLISYKDSFTRRQKSNSYNAHIKYTLEEFTPKKLVIVLLAHEELTIIQ